MKREVLHRLQPENRQRNGKIASILALLISFTAKIEKLKEKLCGFSPSQFSPEGIFEALDLTSKGYLDLFDIKEFLNNDSIQDEDILKLFIRFGATSAEQKLTYHGYLQLLKPHFSQELARDLLLRDTLRRNIPIGNKASKQPTQTIVLLIHDLFLLNCICVSQHESAKAILMDEYMLNELELIEILGLSQSRSPLKAIYQFIDCNSQYEVEEGEIKFLLAYLRISEFQLVEEPAIANLFLPTRINSKQDQTKKPAQNKARISDKDLEMIRINYDKKYIGKNDLLSSTQKISFLNFVHPNSFKYPQAPKGNHIDRKKITQRQEPQEKIASEHAILDIYNDHKMKASLRNFKKIDGGPDSERIYESQVQPSNIFESGVHRRLVNGSQVPIHTPVLEQFMHERNLKTNMGQYKPQRVNELNVLLEESVQSHLSQSEAFERVPKYQNNILNVPNNQKSPQLRYSRKNEEIERYNQSRMNNSRKIGLSEGPGILDQFVRRDLG